MKRVFAIMLALAMVFVLCACGKSAEVKNAEDLINAIGEVTADSGDAIAAAEQAFQALSAEDQAKVENADVLPDAREALEKAIAEKEAAELEALRQSVLGRWDYTQDSLAEIADTVDLMIFYSMGIRDLAFADYLDKFEVRIAVNFRENGTYTVTTAVDEIEENMRAPLKAYYYDLLRVYFAKRLAEEGMVVEDPYSEDAWRSATEMSFEELIEVATEQDFDELLDGTVDSVLSEVKTNLEGVEAAQGNYQVERGKIYLSDSLDEAISEDKYVSFTLDDAILTLTEQSNVTVFGEEFPLVLSRAA